MEFGKLGVLIALSFVIVAAFMVANAKRNTDPYTACNTLVDPEDIARCRAQVDFATSGAGW